MLGFHTALPILDLEPLDLQIGALPENQAILAEPSILRWFEYRSLGYNPPLPLLTGGFLVKNFTRLCAKSNKKVLYKIGWILRGAGLLLRHI